MIGVTYDSLLRTRLLSDF